MLPVCLSGGLTDSDIRVSSNLVVDKSEKKRLETEFVLVRSESLRSCSSRDYTSLEHKISVGNFIG